MTTLRPGGDPVTVITTHDLLAVHPFLSGLTKEQLELLAPWASRSTFPAGARVFSEGGSADRFWLIRDGQVALDIYVPGRGDVAVETIGPGAVLGWSWLYPPYRWHLGATAVEQTFAVALDAAAVRRLCDADPRLGLALHQRFVGVIGERLQATRVRLLDLYGAGS
jgi:CRP/FNR family transcriptional regulator, cyclic AMP receptor protein